MATATVATAAAVVELQCSVTFLREQPVDRESVRESSVSAAESGGSGSSREQDDKKSAWTGRANNVWAWRKKGDRKGIKGAANRQRNSTMVVQLAFGFPVRQRYWSWRRLARFTSWLSDERPEVQRNGRADEVTV